MKRINELSPGVFLFSNGQVGTRELPVFLSECAYFRPAGEAICRIGQVMKAPGFKGKSWREQLADVRKALHKKTRK